MPCNDGDDRDQRPDVPAWMLCEAMIIIDKAGVHDECSEQLKRWWEQHQAGEAQRVRREAAARLDARQRHALGIDENGNPLGRPRGRK